MRKNSFGMLMIVALVVAGAFLAQEAQAQAYRTTTEVVELTNFTGVGESHVTRTENGASFTYSTTGLEPGHVYTLWWFIIGPDGDDDGFIVLNAAGTVATADGEGHFAGHLQAGVIEYPLDENGEIDDSQVRLTGNFYNPLDFNIAFILITHGAKIPELISEQLSTRFGGDCSNDPDNTNPGPDAVDCTEIQVARLHPPAP